MSLPVRAFPLRDSINDRAAFADALSTERKADTPHFYWQSGIAHVEG